jgi:hypothetical protein
MSSLPLASDTPGLQDALARYTLNKKPFVQAEYDKFITFILADMVNMTELNNFMIMNDYTGLDLTFVTISSRTLDTVKMICNKLESELVNKGYYAEIQPFIIPGDTSNLLSPIGISYTISAAPPPLFY